MSQSVKNQLALGGTCVPFLVWDDPLEEGKATHSSILAWRFSMDREGVAYFENYDLESVQV